jgi:hypothetical protein
VLDAIDGAVLLAALAVGAGADVVADRVARRRRERERRRVVRRARAEIAARDPHEDASGWRP